MVVKFLVVEVFEKFSNFGSHASHDWLVIMGKEFCARVKQPLVRRVVIYLTPHDWPRGQLTTCLLSLFSKVIQLDA